jgi:hypothetical protein
MSFHILCNGAIRISLGLHLFATRRTHFYGVHDFCKECQWIPSGFHSVSVDFTFYDFHTFYQWSPCEVIKFTYIIQGVLRKILVSEDFHNMFCKGHPFGFHRIPIGISLATPVILQWALLRINFVVFMHFAWVPLLTISLDLLSF